MVWIPGGTFLILFFGWRGTAWLGVRIAGGCIVCVSRLQLRWQSTSFSTSNTLAWV
jgi:hypothetical protein